MEPIDVKAMKKDEIILRAKEFASSSKRDKYFLHIMYREDVKELMPKVFKTFLSYPSEMFYLRISNDKYANIFQDLIKENINEIVNNLLNGNIIDDEDEILDDVRKARRNSMALNDFMDTYSSLVYDNIDLLVNNNVYFVEILQGIKGYDGYNDAILKNKKLILEKLDYHLNHSGGSNREMMIREDSVFLFNLLGNFSENEIKENEKLIIQLITSVINKLNINSFFIKTMKEDSIEENKNNERADILNSFSNLAKKNTKINELLHNNIDFIISLFSGKTLESLKEEGLLPFYEKMFEQTTFGVPKSDKKNHENLNYNDIKYSSGLNSAVAIIGDKVLKNGQKDSIRLPYHRRFLQPVIRESIKSLKNDNQYTFFEVYETVDVDSVTEEDTYMIFKELLEDNIFWGDPDISNIGRLLKPNRPYVQDAISTKKDEEYYVDNDTVGFTGKRKREILDAGEVVITDLDCIYDFDNRELNIKEIIEKELMKDEYFSVNSFINKYLSNQLVFPDRVRKYLGRYIDEVKEKIDTKKASI